MRIIMMGTGPFAVPTFVSLTESEHEVAALVTRPVPAVRSRGKTPRNPMREAASAGNVPIWDPPNVNTDEVRQQLQQHAADLLVVCDYGQILARETLAITPLGGINLHGSLLPKYRGAAPVQWAVWNGETETGITVIHMTPRLDAGPCLVQTRTPIAPSESAEELEARLAIEGIEGVFAAIDLLTGWDGESVLGLVQENAAATRAPRLKKSDGEVDWTQDADRICHQVRALKPWPGTFTHWHRDSGDAVRLILDEVSRQPEGPEAAPGTATAVSAAGISVATGSGTLQLSRLQPAGKRAMSVADFLRGHPIDVGARFGPP